MICERVRSNEIILVLKVESLNKFCPEHEKNT